MILTLKLSVQDTVAPEQPVGLTPLRRLATTDAQGCHVLGDSAAAFRDGSEAQVAALVQQATDLSSMSDQLFGAAATWPQLYHLASSRANILRALHLPRSATVLEVGAGCGAITRYLGEACAMVDALEPSLDRARVARLRSADLSTVEVFVGGIAQLPIGPAYDVVVVVGVLEYLGSGTADAEPYLESLARLRSVLRDGGTMIIAIENRLGVKYLAGAPEDHSGRVYDSIEGYMRGAGKARTFSRAKLEELLAQAGFTFSVLSAFPDFKLARAIFSDDLYRTEPSLAWGIPTFPSPDWAGPERHRTVSESLLWRSLVEAGVGQHFANSFLVLARKDGTVSTRLWPDDQLAAFYHPHRGKQFATETRLFRSDSALHFQRRPLFSGEADGAADLVQTLQDSTYIPGTEMTEEMVGAGDDRLKELLREWLLIVDANKAEAGAIDALPRNIICTADGNFLQIDNEWRDRTYTRDDIVKRGVLLTGLWLAEHSPPERWQGVTAQDVIIHIGALAGMASNGAWIEDAVEREAALQVRVEPPVPRWAHRRDKLGEIREALWRRIRVPLTETPLGDRDHDRAVRAEAAIARSREQAIRILLGARIWRSTKPLRVMVRALQRRLH